MEAIVSLTFHPIEGHLSGLQFGAIISEAAMNIPWTGVGMKHWACPHAETVAAFPSFRLCSFGSSEKQVSRWD